MATTGTEALNAALAIMDELGSTEYNARAPYIINTLQDKLYPLSDGYVVGSDGVRPVCTRIATLGDALGLDDVLGGSVLPYGLAAQLMLGDDPSQAANFEAIFQERIAEAKRTMPAVEEDIEDVYGVTEYAPGASWGSD